MASAASDEFRSSVSDILIANAVPCLMGNVFVTAARAVACAARHGLGSSSLAAMTGRFSVVAAVAVRAPLSMARSAHDLPRGPTGRAIGHVIRRASSCKCIVIVEHRDERSSVGCVPPCYHLRELGSQPLDLLAGKRCEIRFRIAWMPNARSAYHSEIVRAGDRNVKLTRRAGSGDAAIQALQFEVREVETRPGFHSITQLLLDLLPDVFGAPRFRLHFQRRCLGHGPFPQWCRHNCARLSGSEKTGLPGNPSPVLPAVLFQQGHSATRPPPSWHYRWSRLG